MTDVEYIKASINLRDHAESYLGPPAKNGRFWCPWCQRGGFGADHNAPALDVDTLYHCFGCGRGGDVITWEMEYNEIEFEEAIRRLGGEEPVDKDERLRMLEERAREAEQELEDKIQRAQRVLQELRAERKWLEYYRNLEKHPEGVMLWHERGLADEHLAYWQFGYDPRHRFYVRGHGEWITPTLSIPYLGPDGECQDVKHRLINVPDGGGKYRHEKSGLPKSLWVANYDQPIEGVTVVCEGEIKTAVTYATIDNPKVQAVGLPSKSAGANYLAHLENAEPIYLVLDPDATDEAEALARKLGPGRCRIVDLPDKIDDLIVGYGLGRDWVRSILRSARPLS